MRELAQHRQHDALPETSPLYGFDLIVSVIHRQE
jgi:hypothetical protein